METGYNIVVGVDCGRVLKRIHKMINK